MSRKRPTGKCHICGEVGLLSFEHVPPRAAFNDRRVVEFGLDQAEKYLSGEKVTGRINQRGSGAYTLCERCNNLTGKWYAKRFVDWCYQGMNILVNSKGKPTLIYMHYLFPLAIIKQILTMFCSVNGPNFAESHPELVSFLLNRDQKYLPPKYRIYTFFNVEGIFRQTSVTARYNIYTRRMNVMSEISFPPFGYLISFDSPPPDERLIDISYFARYSYQDWVIQELKLPVLPTHFPFAGDYRNLGETAFSNENK